ncbi:MAG TPA: undecaprenyl-diphosphatase UppP [Thermomicrobiales bacterium]|nr:undecaprenyl-diphosphatase UppP [Thermomicrobiales bacterium]
MEWWQAIILGIVQGLTEFLPISSSGHLIIFPWLFDWETPGLSFDASLHLGTLLAVVVYFSREILLMLRAIPVALSNPVGLLTGTAPDGPRHAEARLGLLIVVATIPGLIAGLLLESVVEEVFHTEDNSTLGISVIATMLIVVGIVLWVAERVGHRAREISGMRWADALVIGLAQALAIIPGTSRSGATITAGLFRGLERDDAARFSFLAGMPLILGAGLKSLLDVLQEGTEGSDLFLYLLGGVSAAVVGFATIWGLLRFLQRQSTFVFTVYRVIFGLFLFLMLAVQ